MIKSMEIKQHDVVIDHSKIICKISIDFGKFTWNLKYQRKMDTELKYCIYLQKDDNKAIITFLDTNSDKQPKLPEYDNAIKILKTSLDRSDIILLSAVLLKFYDTTPSKEISIAKIGKNYDVNLLTLADATEKLLLCPNST